MATYSESIMMDIHTTEVRSKNMRAIKAKNTQPELLVRKGLYRKGIRYRVNHPFLPGKPDIYVTKYKAAIFINGCFWHAHSCSMFKLPKSRQAFWKKKLSDSIERDRKNILALTNSGHRVLVIWECATKGKHKLLLDHLLLLIITWLNSDSFLGYIDSNGLSYFNRHSDIGFNGLIGNMLTD